ncbi:MAG: DUF2130 domain-containing protein [Candidatus Omnitrophica bacterium]|nr:DUF2130 domain-containing protein [Candidatus Omnitrophota bacterium]
MTQEKIKCPQCGTQFELTEVISREIEATISQKYETQISTLRTEAEAREKQLKEQFKSEQHKIAEQAKRDAAEALKIELETIRSLLSEKSKKLEAADKKELELIKREQSVQEKERSMSLDFENKLAVKEKEIRALLDKEKKAAEEKVRKQAEQAYSVELKDTQEQLKDLSKQLEESRQQELALRKRQRELEDREKSLELDAMRKVDAEKGKITEEAKRQFEEKHRLKDAEKDKKLADMTRQIDELKRKAEQGSQQAQGEILELDLEGRLHSRFPMDDIEPIQKGIKGGDALETVKSQLGHACGKILWESKRTKAWSDSWIQKAKDDQLAAKADLVVIMTEILPKGVQQFDQINGVWVVDISSAINLAVALRTGMIQVARERELQAGKQGKMELVYNYLTGPEFRNRIEAMVSSFVAIKSVLDAEKRAMQKLWARREKQIERVIDNISGMHGDLEGIAGKALPVIRVLELPVDGGEGESVETQEWLKDDSLES